MFIYLSSLTAMLVVYCLLHTARYHSLLRTHEHDSMSKSSKSFEQALALMHGSGTERSTRQKSVAFSLTPSWYLGLQKQQSASHSRCAAHLSFVGQSDASSTQAQNDQDQRSPAPQTSFLVHNWLFLTQAQAFTFHSSVLRHYSQGTVQSTVGSTHQHPTGSKTLG